MSESREPFIWPTEEPQDEPKEKGEEKKTEKETIQRTMITCAEKTPSATITVNVEKTTERKESKYEHKGEASRFYTANFKVTLSLTHPDKSQQTFQFDEKKDCYDLPGWPYRGLHECDSETWELSEKRVMDFHIESNALFLPESSSLVFLYRMVKHQTQSLPGHQQPKFGKIGSWHPDWQGLVTCNDIKTNYYKLIAFDTKTGRSYKIDVGEGYWSYRIYHKNEQQEMNFGSGGTHDDFYYFLRKTNKTNKFAIVRTNNMDWGHGLLTIYAKTENGIRENAKMDLEFSSKVSSVHESACEQFVAAAIHERGRDIDYLSVFKKIPNQSYQRIRHLPFQRFLDDNQWQSDTYDDCFLHFEFLPNNTLVVFATRYEGRQVLEIDLKRTTFKELETVETEVRQSCFDNSGKLTLWTQSDCMQYEIEHLEKYIEKIRTPILTKYIADALPTVEIDACRLIAQYTGHAPGLTLFSVPRTCEQFPSYARINKKFPGVLTKLSHQADSVERHALMRLLMSADQGIPLVTCAQDVLKDFEAFLAEKSHILKFLMKLSAPEASAKRSGCTIM